MDLMLQTLIDLVKWYSSDLKVSYYECIIGSFKLQIYSQIHDSWSWRICHLVGKDKVERELERSHKLHNDAQESKDICIESLYRIGKTFYGKPIDWNGYRISGTDSGTTREKPLMLQTLIDLVEWDDNNFKTDSYYEAFIGASTYKLEVENHGGDLYCMSHDSWSWKITHLPGQPEETTLGEGQGYDTIEEVKNICIESLYEIGKVLIGRMPVDWNDFRTTSTASLVIPDTQHIKIQTPIIEANESLPVKFVILRDILLDCWHAKIVCANNVGFTIWDSRWVYQKPGNYLAFGSSDEALQTCLEVYDGLVHQ